MEHDALARGLGPKPNESRGFVHKRILGAAGGFVSGGFTGALSGFARGGRPTRPTSVLGVQPSQVTSKTSIRPFGFLGPRIETSSVRSFTIPAGTGRVIGEIAGEVLDRRARGPVAPTADGCPKGFHLNKSSYSLKDGTRIEERTLCVKNRRRNNDNGKAALRAARRLVGRKKHQETIDKALRAIAPRSSRRSKSAPPARGPVIVSTAG